MMRALYLTIRSETPGYLATQVLNRDRQNSSPTASLCPGRCRCRRRRGSSSGSGRVVGGGG